MDLVVVNEVLSELYGSTGVGALATLLVAELIPPAARVSSAQVRLTRKSSEHTFPDHFRGDVHHWNALNRPLPLIQLHFRPCLLRSNDAPSTSYRPLPLQVCSLLTTSKTSNYYRNLPETAAKTVCDIVHGLDDEVRSRVSTGRYHGSKWDFRQTLPGDSLF